MSIDGLQMGQHAGEDTKVYDVSNGYVGAALYIPTMNTLNVMNA